MQFEERLKKYLKKKSQKKWTLNSLPTKNKYKTIIIVPSKAENNTLPLLLNSISNQNKIYLILLLGLYRHHGHLYKPN